MRTLLLATILFLLLSVSSGFAQAQVTTLTLEEAIDLALENNINLQQLTNNLQRNEADILSAYGNFLPNLNASSNANRSTGQQFNQSTLTLDTFTQYSMNANLSTNVPIFTGWQNISNLRRAQSEQRSQETELQRVRENVIFETVSEYLQIILNQELLMIAKENLSTAQRQLEQVDAQVEVGLRPIVDLYNQEAIVANRELDVIQRQNALNLSVNRLIRILQLDPLLEYDFVIPEIDESSIITTEYNLEELINAALNNRKDLLALEYNIQTIEHNIRGARSGYLPRLSFNASLGTNYSDSYRGIEVDNGSVNRVPRSFSDQFFDERIQRSFGLNLQIPIFDRFQTRSSVQNQQINLKNAKLTLIDRQSLIYQEVRQAYNDYQSFASELVASEKALIAAERAFETQQERYNVGSSTLIELTTANNEFISAASNRIQTIYRFIFQEKLLDFYLGIITEDISL